MHLTRRHVTAGLGAIAIAPMFPFGADATPKGAADAVFENLAQHWLDNSLRLSPVSATQTGDHRFDAALDDVSKKGRTARLQFAKQTLARLDKLRPAALSRDNQVDAAVLANALRAQIWSDEVAQDWAWNPLGYQGIAGGAIYGLMAREFAPLPQRLIAATRRMEKLPELFAQTRAALDPARVPAPYAAIYAQQNKGLKSIARDMIAPYADELSGAARAQLEHAIAISNYAIDQHQTWIEGTLTPAAKGEFRAGADMFDQRLKFTLQSDLTRGEIRRRADAAVLDIRRQMYEVARAALKNRADAPPLPDVPNADEQQKAIRAAVELAASERPARDKLVAIATSATEAARQYVAENGLITLPEGPVRIILMPEFQRGVAVAYCDSPGPLEKNLDTFYAVSPIPDDWSEEQATSFLREYNLRGIQDIAVHEAMPGHYVQIYHSNRHPSVTRAVLGSGSFIEGWAVYAEHMMVEQGFLKDDPFYRLTQLKVLLRTVTNAIIDQGIHCEGMTETDVIKFLTETAFQEEREAAGKWRRAQVSITQLSTYFVGYSEHIDARVTAEKRDGAAFKLKAYHDGILAHGSPPMRYARALYLGEAIG